MNLRLLIVVAALVFGPRADVHSQGAGERPTAAQVAALDLSGLPVATGALMANASASGASESAAAATPGIVRARAATISPDYLQALLTADELKVGSSGAVIGAPPALVLNLFEDLSLRAVKLEMSRDGLGNTIWRGALVEGGTALLVVDNQQVTGDIRTGSKLFRISPMAEGVHRIMELDPAARPKGRDDGLRPPLLQGAPPIGPRKNFEKPQATGMLTINVLFVYTAKARSEVANITSAISLAVAYTNTALSNSQIGAQINLVGTSQVTYAETTKTMNNVLDDLRANAGDLERVSRLRSAFDADLVEMWIDRSADTNLCGLAYVLEDADQPGLNPADVASYGFSVITTDFNGGCLTDSVAHELGHNLGARHDRFVEENAVPGPEGYNYGYVDVPHRFKDIMAYDDKCDEQNVSCPTVQYFSNPSITYQGHPLGVSESQADAANDSRRIGEIAPYVAQFRDHLLAPTALVRLGRVSSALQTTAGSYLRFYNTGANAGVATVTLEDPDGQLLGTWISPRIPAGAELQYPLTTIENGLTPAFTKPSYYSVGVRTNFNGYLQHVLFRPLDGTLTNLSTCSAGVTADPSRISGVHTSILGMGFPSRVVITNTGTSGGSASLGVYDAATGTQRGFYTSPIIQAGGQSVIAVGLIEDGMGKAPTSTMFHYVVKIENSFNGFLQHLVNNAQADMTTACALEGFATLTTSSPLRSSVVFSTLQTSSQSFLRFHNTGSSAGTVTATVRDFASGQSYGQCTSPSIAPDAELQFSIGTIEQSLSLPPVKPPYYSVTIQPGFSGSYAHVLFRPSDGTLTNLSTCAAGVTADPGKLNGVHTSVLASGFPSSIVLTNTGTSATTATLGIFDARNGTRIAGYTTTSIPAKGHQEVTVQSIENFIGHTASGNEFHYTVRVEGTFTGFLQHLVNNMQAGVITDMTTGCILP